MLWTRAHQTPLSMGSSRQEYWTGLPCSPPGDLLHPGIEPTFLVSCIGRWVLYHLHHLGIPLSSLTGWELQGHHHRAPHYQKRVTNHCWTWGEPGGFIREHEGTWTLEDLDKNWSDTRKGPGAEGCSIPDWTSALLCFLMWVPFPKLGCSADASL